ncbi:MAG: hypothetical protein RJA36_3904 [Pseudomonadota bacterium]|jgi:hypothetical protein
MVVTILRPLEMADAGRMRVFTIGQVTTLPDVVAARLIDRGMVAPHAGAAAREHAIAAPAETGGRRRR